MSHSQPLLSPSQWGGHEQTVDRNQGGENLSSNDTKKIEAERVAQRKISGCASASGQGRG
jgi:hypothetical protein